MRHHIFLFVREKKTIVGIGALLCLVLVGVLFFKSGGGTDQTEVVQPGDFLQQVSVSGKVVAAQDVELGFSGGGRVSYVRARVGDTVAAGTVLAEIENGDARATVAQKQAVLASQQAKLESLQNGTRPESLAVAQTAVDGAASALAQANQGVVDAILDAYAKSDDVVHNKVDRFINNPNTPSLALTFNTSDSQLASDLLSKRTAVGGVLSVWQADTAHLPTTQMYDVIAGASRAQKNLSDIATLLATASAALSQATPSQATSQTLIQNYAGDITLARATINTAIAALNTSVTAQKSATAAVNAADKNLQLLQAGATQADIDTQTALVASAEADVENAQAQLQKTLIVAPFSGVVTTVDAKVGQIVSQNTPEIGMIGTGAFQIESYVPEINIALLKVGNPATVTLDAYGPDAVFDASIVSIDPAETLQNGVSTYRAVLQFAAQDPRIKSGMTASVVVTSQKRSGVITVPQGLVIDRNGKKFLKVKQGGVVVEVEVTLGAVSSLGDVEVLSGLKAGDAVLTTPLAP
ncbi:MAG: efflux RND transporter periplasmic adaptor subunit [bacterium]